MGQPATANLGRYELLSELGRGGMAELFVGRLQAIGGFAKLVAIKRILPHLSQDPKFVDLFLNEGRIASRLSHPNLCQVFELGEADGQLYLVMEYLEGVTWEGLARALPDDPSLVLRAVATVMAQACEGLHYAHELRGAGGAPSPVIHRDISPQNLFVTVDGVCKILDFGVAKMVNDVTSTRSGVLKGKLPYMSPEQIRGERLDGRSDTFALGVVVWEGLVRRELFMRDTEFHIWKAILEDSIPTVSAHAPTYGDDVDRVVMQALARERDARYASIRELGTALRSLADAHGGALSAIELGELVRTHCAEPLARRARAIAGLATRTAPAAPRAELPQRAATTRVELRDDSHVVGPTPRRRQARIATALAALAAVAAVVTLVVTQVGGDDEAAASPAVSVPPTTMTPTTTGTAPTSPTTTTPAAPHASATTTDATPPASTTTAATTTAATTTAATTTAATTTAATTTAATRTAATTTAATTTALTTTAATKPTPRVTTATKATPASRTKPSRPAPPETPRVPSTGTTTAPAVASTVPGTLSVDVRPSARVYIDGAFVDETPIYRRALSAGTHELRVVRPDGAERVRAIRIEAGTPLNLGTLQW